MFHLALKLLLSDETALRSDRVIRPVSGLLIIAFAIPSHNIFITVVLLLLTVTVAGAVPDFNWFLVSPNELLIKTIRQTPNKNDTLLNTYATFNLRLFYSSSIYNLLKGIRHCISALYIYYVMVKLPLQGY